MSFVENAIKFHGPVAQARGNMEYFTLTYDFPIFFYVSRQKFINAGGP